MSVKKKTGIILLTAAAMVFSGGCGKALVFDNEPQDTTGGNIISGIPLTESKVKPALSIPEQTGSHTTTATTKKKAETSPKENSSADEPSVDTSYDEPPVPDEEIPSVETVTSAATTKKM